jgi:hypothetical protein
MTDNALFEKDEAAGSTANVNGGGAPDRHAHSIHMSLQGKGGVGKSLVSSILAQYFVARGRDVRCFDTDPVNRTLFQYKSLNVERVDLLDEGTIDHKVYDDLFDRLLTEDATFVIDNGASTFIQLWRYLLEWRAAESLAERGKKLYIHTVITGGQALVDTLHGFHSLAASGSEQNIIVWLNEYFGRIERDGKRFDQMGAFLESKSRVYGSVHLPRRNPDTFGRDMEDVISRKLTIDEAIKEGPFSLVAKQRMKIMQRDWFEQLDRLELV